MSRYQITVSKDANIAVVRTIERHGQGKPNTSIFAGAERTVIALS